MAKEYPSGVGRARRELHQGHLFSHRPACKQVAAAGHAIGSHTWCHQDLSKTKGRCLANGKMETVEYDPKDEIEKGISAVHWAVGGPTAPYFRFPALRHRTTNSASKNPSADLRPRYVVHGWSATKPQSSRRPCAARRRSPAGEPALGE